MKANARNRKKKKTALDLRIGVLFVFDIYNLALKLRRFRTRY